VGIAAAAACSFLTALCLEDIPFVAGNQRNSPFLKRVVVVQLRRAVGTAREGSNRQSDVATNQARKQVEVSAWTSLRGSGCTMHQASAEC
jgi:hypothetical protein